MDCGGFEGSDECCHRPPTGRREAPPDDRLQRTIKYSSEKSWYFMKAAVYWMPRFRSA
jgi:hypothetical protein